MFGLGQPKQRTVLARLQDVESAIAEIGRTQVELAEAFRSKGNGDAELRDRLGAVEHNADALVSAVSDLRAVVGEEPAPVQIEAQPEPSPFSGDNPPAEPAETEPVE